MSFATLGVLVAGMAALVGGAELVVRGASRIARAFGMSPLLVGLTLVAFGTSAPEVAVSVGASLAGRTGVALGNVVGSNIFNVLLVLGVSAVIAPLVVERKLVRMDVPVLIGVSALPLLFGLDLRLARWEGVLLVVLGIVYTTVLVALGLGLGREGRTDTPGGPDGEDGAGGGADEDGRGPGPATGTAWRARLLDTLMIAGGLFALVVGAGWFVSAAAAIARSFGVSELVIGLTLVAGATSLPEMATSILAAVRGERDIAVGNAVGSNIFNVLFVLGASAAVVPGGMPVPVGALSFDFPIMLAVAVACLPVFLTGWRISRGEGMVFVGYYVVYMVYLLLDASTHDARDDFVTALVLFVIPLTIVLLAGGWWWARHSKEARGARGL